MIKRVPPVVLTLATVMITSAKPPPLIIFPTYTSGAAEKASVDDWTTARAQLAADYGSYAEAVARAEFAASGSSS